MTDPYNCPFANIDYSFLNVPTADPLLHDTDNLFSLESPQITFDQDAVSRFNMEVEDNFQDYRPALEREISYIESPYSPNLMIHTETQIIPNDIPPGKIRIYIEIDDDLLIQPKKPAQDEEAISTTTKETLGSHSESVTRLYFEGTFEDIPLELQADCKTTLSTFLEKRPGQERTYIEKVLPYLLGSLKEAFSMHQQPVLNKMVFETILKELIYGKEAIIGMDQKVIRNLVSDEIDKIKSYRPMEIGYGDQELAYRRKEKKIVKGNVNQSSMNHLSENYVSNVFKFAKANYPNDKELQQLTSQRGVSATNFRNSMNAQLNDDILVRKAKVRIVASGQEFINNIEYWMQGGGYFENCKDKDKYIQYKQKAICNLSLDRQY